MTPTRRVSLELVLKKKEYWPQCLALLPPGLQRDEGVRSSGAVHALDPWGEEWPQMLGLGSAISPAAHGSPAAEDHCSSCFPPGKWLQRQHIPEPHPSLSLKRQSLSEKVCETE